MKDAIFLSGLFFDFDVPREKMFLFKYFRSPLEKQFVKYYLCMGEIDNFVDHTGYFCQMKWLKVLRKRIEGLLAAHSESKRECNLEKLSEIENGKFKL